jgi:hypothetical protein
MASDPGSWILSPSWDTPGRSFVQRSIDTKIVDCGGTTDPGPSSLIQRCWGRANRPGKRRQQQQIGRQRPREQPEPRNSHLDRQLHSSMNIDIDNFVVRIWQAFRGRVLRTVLPGRALLNQASI